MRKNLNRPTAPVGLAMAPTPQNSHTVTAQGERLKKKTF